MSQAGADSCASSADDERGESFYFCNDVTPVMGLTFTALQHLLTPSEQPCLRVAVESGIADILSKSSDGMHVEEIAKKAPKPIEPQKLSRIIRFMASRGYFREGFLYYTIRLEHRPD